MNGEAIVVSAGKAANVAVIASRLGAEARLVGCVGDDTHADQALAGPVSAAVDVDLVRRVDAPTAVSMIAVTDDGEKTILLAPGANDAWAPEDVERLRQAIREAPAGRLRRELVPLVDHLVPNASEAAEVTGRRVGSFDDACAAGRALREHGAGAVSVTRRDAAALAVAASTRAVGAYGSQESYPSRQELEASSAAE
jgi:ribokinase